MVGGQLKGDTVKMDVGNNLNIQSLQDTDDYDYEKISASVSGTAGTGFSANGSISATNIDSKWASVTDQSGIFAGKGGYDIYVGNNTDLKGAVIASEAEDKSKNKLDTGTISFSDIKNKADFKVTHVSVSGGTGGPGVPTAYQNSDSDSSTTKSAVEKGELIIRNKEQQKQDINELSRDTESANNPLKQIFDKQKELDKIETVELIKDIAQQAKSVMNKYDRIQAQNDVDKNKDALSKLEAEKAYNKLSDAEKAKYKTVEDYYNQNKDYFYYVAVDEQLKTNRENNKNLGGMGSDVSKGIDSAISIVTGIITGDITGGLAGASAPWVAEQIKKHTGHKDENGNWKTDDVAGNLIAHAILGAVVAELQGNSGLAGGAGAVTGELAADIIREQLYGKKAKDLTEAEKENISALAQLATGLAVASVGGDVGDVSTGIAAGKNAVENNAISGQFVGKSEEEIIKKIRAQANCENDREGCELVGTIVVGTILAPIVIPLLPEEAIIGGALSATANIGGQYFFNKDKKINWTDVGIATGVGGITGGLGSGFWGTVGWNAAGGATSSYLEGKDPLIGGLIGAGSSSFGYGAGKLVEKPLQSWINPVANKYIHETNKGFLGITGHFTESYIPTWSGNMVNSGFSTVTEKLLKKNLRISKMRKNKKYWALLYLIIATPVMFFCSAIIIEVITLITLSIVYNIDFIFEKKYIYIAYKFACFGFPAGVFFWFMECRRLGVKIFGK